MKELIKWFWTTLFFVVGIAVWYELVITVREIITECCY